MKGLHWEDCPADVKRQAHLAKQYVHDYLKDALIGVYVHGSLCLGAFYPERSDLDMLVVINRPLTAEERFQLMAAFLGFHRTPAPIEISIMLEEDLKAWKHPAPYQFHFSNCWRKRYAEMLYWDDASFWDYEGERTDIDLACHVTLTRQFGVTLLGPSADELFPVVPETDFWDSIRCGAEGLMREPEEEGLLLVEESGALGVVTLLRVWSYQEHGVFFSKSEAAEWAMTKLPEKLLHISRYALEVYLGQRTSFRCSPQEWNELRTMLLAYCPHSAYQTA